MGVVLVASLSFAWAPAIAVAQAPDTSNQSGVTSGTQSEGAKPTEQTGSSASAPAAPSAAQVGDRLHDSAKSLGDAILDGIKYVGHKVSSFFTGEKS
jgi:hypothetical protein